MPRTRGDATLVEEAGEEEFADAGREWGGGGVGEDALAAEGDGDGHLLAFGFPRAPVARAVVVDVPVHRGSLPAEELDAVHADVVAWGLGVVRVVGVDGVDAGEGDVAAAEVGVPLGTGAEAGDVVVDVGGVADGGEVAVEGPAAEDREGGEVGGVTGEDDLLAGAAAGFSFGGDFKEGEELLGFGEEVAEAGRRFGLDERADLRGEGLETVGTTEGHLGAAVGAVCVDEEGKAGAFDVLEEEGVAAAVMEAGVGAEGGAAGDVCCGGFALEVGDGGDLKDGGDWCGDATQLARGLKCRDELSDRSVHGQSVRRDQEVGPARTN